MKYDSSNQGNTLKLDDRFITHIENHNNSLLINIKLLNSDVCYIII